MSKYDFEIDLSEQTSTGILLSKIQKGSVVLEFGCATGRMTRYMKEELDCQVYIVEYDEDAYKTALEFAADGLCDDIMKFQWCERFKGIQFDAILFADVLEHLNTPEKVLEEAGKLLKEDGCIYVSIPNITHNDILLKAMDERFDYTSTGILDDTHVHFWGLGNVQEITGNCGLSVHCIEATYCPTGFTEQYAGSRTKIGPVLSNLLKERTGGEIYQFVLSIGKENKSEPILKIKQPSVSSQLYIRYEDEQRPEEHIHFESRYSGNGSYITRYVIENAEKIKRVQYTPVMDSCCILQNFSIRQGQNNLFLTYSKVSEMEDALLLMGEPPTVYADCQKMNEPIIIEAEIILPGERFIEIIKRDYHNPRSAYKETFRQLDYYRKNYPIIVSRMELAEAKYEMIENATFWKMTKPMRDMAEAFKNIGRNIKKSLSSPYSKKELEKQKNVHFEQKETFSILVPLYNTKPQYLREMIESVQKQTYSEWELCLADGSDQEHNEVRQICEGYAKKDSRIQYKKLIQNLGISENTNACIEMATGNYLALLDHDDILHPAALYEVMDAISKKKADFIYTDEIKFRETLQDAFMPHYKPDYAPDTLRANNYICHFTVFKKSLMDKVGNFRSECDGSQDHDMVLRLTEQAECIVHIPKILYYWRSHAESVAENVDAKPYVVESAHRALRDHMERVGLKGSIQPTRLPSVYRMKYELEGEPLVSIIIPNYEYKQELQTCLESIYEKSTYQNFEVIVVENNSKSDEIFRYYKEIQERWSNLKVVEWKDYFNYSAINNFGIKYAAGEHIILLNNDTEVISPDWIQEMLMYSQRSDVGAVGAKLYYPDSTIQHAGVGIGLLTLAGHYHKGLSRYHRGYMGRLLYAQNVSAVTAACMMIRRDVWDKVEGLDETFEVAFNDVDLCMRIRKAGYLIIWTPFSELYHFESKSRGTDEEPEKQKRLQAEARRFRQRWEKELADGDPYYNPNLPLGREDFGMK